MRNLFPAALQNSFVPEPRGNYAPHSMSAFFLCSDNGGHSSSLPWSRETLMMFFSSLLVFYSWSREILMIFFSSLIFHYSTAGIHSNLSLLLEQCTVPWKKYKSSHEMYWWVKNKFASIMYRTVKKTWRWELIYCLMRYFKGYYFHDFPPRELNNN